MPEWEVTATTVHCETIDDEVTILVSGDAAVTCTARQRKGRSGLCGEETCSLMKETIARFTA